jgi:hypothetical protein
MATLGSSTRLRDADLRLPSIPKDAESLAAKIFALAS